MPERIRKIFQNDFISVTDLPHFDAAGNITGYDFLPADSRAVKDYQNAGVGLLHADRHHQFWKKLGTAVNQSKVARCHGCASYAAKILNDKDFHTSYGRNIWICGRGDHYFIVLSGRAGIMENSSNNNTNIFDDTDIVVDLWVYNTERQQGRHDRANIASTVPNFPFIVGQNDIRVFVKYNA